jgi:hypothetical protein
MSGKHPRALREMWLEQHDCLSFPAHGINIHICPAGAELTVSFGGQFGLTDATSDAALKVFIGYEFF